MNHPIDFQKKTLSQHNILLVDKHIRRYAQPVIKGYFDIMTVHYPTY